MLLVDPDMPDAQKGPGTGKALEGKCGLSAEVRTGAAAGGPRDRHSGVAMGWASKGMTGVGWEETPPDAPICLGAHSTEVTPSASRRRPPRASASQAAGSALEEKRLGQAPTDPRHHRPSGFHTTRPAQEESNVQSLE